MNNQRTGRDGSDKKAPCTLWETVQELSHNKLHNGFVWKHFTVHGLSSMEEAFQMAISGDACLHLLAPNSDT